VPVGGHPAAAATPPCQRRRRHWHHRLRWHQQPTATCRRGPRRRRRHRRPPAMTTRSRRRCSTSRGAPAPARANGCRACRAARAASSLALTLADDADRVAHEKRDSHRTAPRLTIAAAEDPQPTRPAPRSVRTRTPPSSRAADRPRWQTLQVRLAAPASPPLAPAPSRSSRSRKTAPLASRPPT